MKYEIEISDEVANGFQGRKPVAVRAARAGEWVASAGGPLKKDRDGVAPSIILSDLPEPATPTFDPGTYWRWDCHQDGLKPSIVRIATKEESATNCISPRAYEAAVIFPDGLAFIVYRSNLTPWLPQPGERVFHRSLCIYGEVTDVGPTTTSVRWENGDFGQPPTDRLIPAAFAPKPKPAPELHKFCPYCGKVADDFFWVCAECAEESMGNFPTAHGEIQPSASPPSPLLPKPWAKEQPPTLPDGWELSEPEKRLAKRGEWYMDETANLPKQSAIDFHNLRRWIIRRKPDPVFPPRDMQAEILIAIRQVAATVESLAEVLRKVAEGQVAK